jgi:hypothetical protein
MTQQVWHIKDPSLLKAVSTSKFAALSPVMVTATRELKKCSGSSKQSK